MRIPIRIQLTAMVLLASLVALAIIAIATWVINHRFILDISSSRLSLTASLKAAALASNLSLMQAIAHTLSTRVIFQSALMSYYAGNSSASNWEEAKLDLTSALASSQQSVLTLQAAAFPRSASGPSGAGMLLNVSGPIENQIRLPYNYPNGSAVYLGDPGLGFPPNLYPNFTYVPDGTPVPITQLDNYTVQQNQSLMLGPWQINSTFALVSITTPVINNRNATNLLGWLTVVLSASLVFPVLIGTAGIGETGSVLLIGPDTNTNLYQGELAGKTFPLTTNNQDLHDVPVHFILSPNQTNFIARHTTRTYAGGDPQEPFSIDAYPAVVDALTQNYSNFNNAGSLLSTQNEENDSVSVGFALVENSMVDWVLVFEQDHDEVWGPINHLRNVLLGCIFGTAGGMLLIAYPVAYFSSRPILRLRQATLNSIAPPSYDSPDDAMSISSQKVVPKEGSESGQEKDALGVLDKVRGRTGYPTATDDGKDDQGFRIPARVKDRRHIIQDELTDLTSTFNNMSDELRLYYTRLEERVKQRTEELYLAKKSAEAANESKTLFIANISHELKTPLNGILGMCAVCMQENDQTLLKRSLRAIQQSGDLLHNLLTDLLTFSKNQVGRQLMLDEKEFRLRDISSQIQSIFGTQVRESGVPLTIEYEEIAKQPFASSSETPANDINGTAELGRLKDMWLWGDYQRVLQVMINLVSNSLKFTPKGGSVCLRIRCLGEAEEDISSHKGDRGSASSNRTPSRTSHNSKGRSGSDHGSSRSWMAQTRKAAKYLDRRKRDLQIISPDRSPSPPPNGRMLLFQFEVADTGPGIPEHLQKQIFEPFVQGDLRLTKKFGGTGLGLSICSQLAGLMHGSIELQSEVGVGSTFTLHIPLRHTRTRADSTASSFRGQSQRNSVSFDDNLAQISDPHASASPTTKGGSRLEGGDAKPRLLGLSQPFFSQSSPPMASPNEESTRNQNKVKVLVADDNKINQEVVLRMLRLEDIFDVHLATDGQEALDMVKESKNRGEPYDLIFMDVQMPNVDGRQSTRMIRQLGETTPIVALTAFADEINQKECMDSGMDFFLAKPIRRPALKHVLKVYCAPIAEADEGESSDEPLVAPNGPLTGFQLKAQKAALVDSPSVSPLATPA